MHIKRDRSAASGTCRRASKNIEPAPGWLTVLQDEIAIDAQPPDGFSRIDDIVRELKLSPGARTWITTKLRRAGVEEIKARDPRTKRVALYFRDSDHVKPK